MTVGGDIFAGIMLILVIVAVCAFVYVLFVSNALVRASRGQSNFLVDDDAVFAKLLSGKNNGF